MSNLNDPLLDEYLKGETPFSARYRRLDSHDVPVELDRAVLAEASQGIAKRRAQIWWPIGSMVAIAATAVISLSIVLRSGKELTAPVSVASEERLIAKSDQSAARDEVTTVEPNPSQKNAEPVEQRLTTTRKKAESLKQATLMTPPPPPMPEEKLATLQSAAKEADVKAEVPPPVVANEQFKDKDAGVAAPAAVGELKKIPTPPPAAQATSFASTSDATQFRERRSSANAPSSTELSEVVVVTGSNIRSSEPGPEVVYRTDPRGWLAEIRKLRKEGREDEADGLWAAFVEAHPKYKVAKNDLARPKSER